MPVIHPAGASYGWRARIGLIQSGALAETNPFEFYLMAPEGVMIVINQLPRRGTSGQPFSAAMDYLEEGVERVLGGDVDAIVQAGTPHIAGKGWGFEDELRARVAKITSVPFITDIGSSINAMHLLGIERVAMLTPFDEAIHQQISDYLKNAGIEVVAALSMRQRIGEGTRVFSVSIAEIYRGAKEVFRSTDRADGIWITGAAMPSVAAIQMLEDDLNAPVVTSMQAMAWGAFRAVGIRDRIPNFGKLWFAG
jgi:maleate isomerase